MFKVVHHLLLHESSLVFPLDLELSHSGLLNEDVTSQFVNDWLHGWVLIEFLVFIEVVDIVTNSEELLVVVGAGEQDTCHTNNIILRDAAYIWWVTLYNFINIFMSKLIG